MQSTYADEIEIGKPDVEYTYTACTLDSVIPEADLKYQWAITWQQATNITENFSSFETEDIESRTLKIKFLKPGTFTLRCRVYTDDDNYSIGTFAENLPTLPVLSEWFVYTSCTPDTEIDPSFIEYLWIVTRENEEGEFEDATPYVELVSVTNRSLPIKFNWPGTYKLQSVVFCPFALDVFQESTICETVLPVEEIGNIDIVRGKQRVFAAWHPDSTAPYEFMKYQWECAGATIQNENNRICQITFPGYDTYTITCTITNLWAKDSPAVGTLELVHEAPVKPPINYPNWITPDRDQRENETVNQDEFLGRPIYRENYSGLSQANRFWKIWMRDIKKRNKDKCRTDRMTENWLSVELLNVGTGNKYEDAHMDARLYTMDREEHPYNKMYVPDDKFFYIGVHRRETKILPFHIAVRLGDEYLSLHQIPDEDRRYIMNLHDVGPHW